VQNSKPQSLHKTSFQFVLTIASGSPSEDRTHLAPAAAVSSAASSSSGISRPWAKGAAIGSAGRVIALAALAFVAPLMISIAIAINLDSRGPVLFKQRRFGFNDPSIEGTQYSSGRRRPTVRSLRRARAATPNSSSVPR
jgi:hypothetical protein